MANGEDVAPAYPQRSTLCDVLDDGEDVTHLTERQLLMRLANGKIATDYTLGQVLGATARLETRMATMEARLAPGGEIDHRQRMTSSHAIENVADTIAAKLFAEWHGPRGGHNNLTKESVVEVVQNTLDAGVLKQFKEDAKEAKKLRTQIKAGAVVALITIVGTAVAAHFEGRASAPAVQTTTK